LLSKPSPEDRAARHASDGPLAASLSRDQRSTFARSRRCRDAAPELDSEGIAQLGCETPGASGILEAATKAALERGGGVAA